jgi:exodeoxyribonuclease VII small subunit
MAAQPDASDQPTTTARRRSRMSGRASDSKSAAEPELMPKKAAAQPSEEETIAGQLTFREAQTALELSLAELQSQDLDVEQMAGLYRRASHYADRCEQLLLQVEQEVMQWDPGQPEDSPRPYPG